MNVIAYLTMLLAQPIEYCTERNINCDFIRQNQKEIVQYLVDNELLPNYDTTFQNWLSPTFNDFVIVNDIRSLNISYHMILENQDEWSMRNKWRIPMNLLYEQIRVNQYFIYEANNEILLYPFRKYDLQSSIEYAEHMNLVMSYLKNIVIQDGKVQYPQTRIISLKYIRNSIGDIAFFNAVLPPLTPWWAYEQNYVLPSRR